MERLRGFFFLFLCLKISTFVQDDNNHTQQQLDTSKQCLIFLREVIEQIQIVL